MAVKCIFSDLMCEQGSVQEKKIVNKVDQSLLQISLIMLTSLV